MAHTLYIHPHLYIQGIDAYDLPYICSSYSIKKNHAEYNNFKLQRKCVYGFDFFVFSQTRPPCGSSLSFLSPSHHYLSPRFCPLPPSPHSPVCILFDFPRPLALTVCLSFCSSSPFLGPWGASAWDLGVFCFQFPSVCWGYHLINTPKFKNPSVEDSIINHS